MKPTSQAAVLFVRGDGKMNELTISLDPHRKTPLYEQIYGFIREEIRGGRIRAGERLPSARALSGYLSVSRSTVDLAYEFMFMRLRMELTSSVMLASPWMVCLMALLATAKFIMSMAL